MFFLVYLSAAVTWFSAKELREMLATCRVNNERDGITGMLLYKDGNFMQALEGEESQVRALLQRITADLRHRGLVVIDSGPTAAREFGAWSMAFTDISARDASLPNGYSEFMDLPLSDPAFVNNPERCHRLLQMFRQID
jgi:Sensors of blue-light using FAD